MVCVTVYKWLCGETRLRFLNLLRRGPLCVCHVQEDFGSASVYGIKAARVRAKRTGC